MSARPELSYASGPAESLLLGEAIGAAAGLLRTT